MSGMSMDVVPFAADPIGWAVAIGGVVVTLWTIYFAIRALLAPGEGDPAHPKHLIFKDDR